MPVHNLTLYSTAGCHLCHEAREMIVALQREFDIRLSEVDIATDRALEQRYRYAVPVVIVDDRLELAAPISERELRAALKQRQT